jgi:outer membrane receptor for ferrienterochelin and colicin
VNKSKFLAASSVLAISSVAGTAAFAQGGDIEQVVVSASRISIAGYQQPTPVSVIGAAALAAAANADIGDTLREMPSMGNSPTPEKGTNGDASNSGALGLSGINLRNLGTNRNLVLLDGQRVVSAIITGGVDLSIIPASLIQRVGRLGFGRRFGRHQPDRQQELHRLQGQHRHPGQQLRQPPQLWLHRHRWSGL